ncbi:selenocysteine-specific translation elongation factor [Desulfovibrio subterraneus]|uniref:selenocysteine-specific translation elongation factor n=1 Tax=Desulfovibrio subterraneus TaxID=2718620 RepID=UPI0022B8B00A|nr:selenocysteine-specific translation elongation factor [Desulfovibrio subterraneus]WBF69074.1 selenocysteine-specific translation elongation factor [Desulfovibrio subterraneus]
MPVVLGTAGHIDHGKTTLVKALTGIDCDRLEEEKKRGITIELGFAFFGLPDGTRMGIVDVPGHERFVKNMVAGASGIDFVMLVIAADEGVMPQTREHLEICSLLGIETGFVALTKTDMVDEEWLALVQEDVANFLQGSFLEGAPIFPVSSHTGAGLDEVRQYIVRMEKELAPRRRSDLFRLPVDRVFTMKGHGTVVTGTMISGSVAIGTDVQLYPHDTLTKVRGLQSHGGTVEVAPAGRRTAINLHGLEVADIERGDVVALPGSLFPSQTWHVELRCLSSAPTPLKNRTEVHVHHGSRETLARLYFPDRDKLMPGETALCEMRFTDPMVGVFGDRCVIRSFSPLRTVAGGKLLHPHAQPLRKKHPRYAQMLEALQSLSKAEPDDRIRLHVGMAGETGVSFRELCILTDIESKALEKGLNLLGGKQELACFDKEERSYVSGGILEELGTTALDFVADYHRKEPLKPGMPRGMLTSGWGRKLAPKLVHFVVERLIKQGKLAVEGDVMRIAGHKVSLAADQEGLRAKLLEAHAAGGITPPNLKDVLEPLNVDVKEAGSVLRLMEGSGELVKVKDGMYFHGPAMEKLVGMVREYFATHDDLGPNEFRDLTGLSRKYLIPLLEYFDKARITLRVGDKRKLRGA